MSSIHTDIIYAPIYPDDGGPSRVEPCLRLLYRRPGMIITASPREAEEVLIPLSIAHKFEHKPEIDGMADQRKELCEAIAELLFGSPVISGEITRVSRTIDEALDMLLRAPPPPPNAHKILSRRAGIRDLRLTWTDPATDTEHAAEIEM